MLVGVKDGMSCMSLASLGADAFYRDYRVARVEKYHLLLASIVGAYSICFVQRVASLSIQRFDSMTLGSR